MKHQNRKRNKEKHNINLTNCDEWKHIDKEIETDREREEIQCENFSVKVYLVLYLLLLLFSSSLNGWCVSLKWFFSLLVFSSVWYFFESFALITCNETCTKYLRAYVRMWTKEWTKSFVLLTPFLEFLMHWNGCPFSAINNFISFTFFLNVNARTIPLRLIINNQNIHNWIIFFAN